MDIPSIWGLYTLLLMIVFLIIAIWAWGGKRKKGFDEAANLPFTDEPDHRDELTRPEHKETKP